MLSVKQAGVAEATNQLDYDNEVAFHAVRFLKDHARSAKRRPFFLTVSFTHPHDPYSIRAEYWNRYQDREIDPPRDVRFRPSEWTRTAGDCGGSQPWTSSRSARTTCVAPRRAYYGAISYVDDRVGELLATLRTFDLARRRSSSSPPTTANCSASADCGTRCTCSSARCASR